MDECMKRICPVSKKKKKIVLCELVTATAPDNLSPNLVVLAHTFITCDEELSYTWQLCSKLGDGGVGVVGGIDCASCTGIMCPRKGP